MKIKKNIKFIYVYIITNLILNKQYVGSHVCYKNDAYNDNYWGSSKYLKKDYNIYGKENFTKLILEFYDVNINKINLLENESKFILKYNTLSPIGYNRFLPNSKNNFYTLGTTHEKITRKKISTALKGTKHDEEFCKRRSELTTGEANPMFGKKHTLKTINKIKKSLENYIVSDETRKKLSISLTGRVFSDKHRANLSKSLKKVDHSASIGLKRTDETRKNISVSLTGRVFSDEHRANLSKSLKNRKLSAEHRNNISISLNEINKNKNK